MGVLAESFRHSGWHHDRTRVLASLRRTAQTAARLRSFSNCGVGAYILKSNTDPPEYRLAGSTCHDRFCLPCGQQRSRQIARNLIDHVTGRRVRFITLTTGLPDDSLRNMLDHLYTSFRALQRRKVWRKHVKGGVAFLELKRSSRSPRWHPHLHLIVEGSYIPHAQLKHEWQEASKGDSIVWIRGNIRSTQIMNYVTKYASKPMDTSFLRTPEYLDQAVVALKSRRLCITWGGWRKVLLTRKDDEAGWENIGLLIDWLQAAREGNIEARAILHKLDPHAAETVLATFPPQPRAPPPPSPIAHQQLPLIDTRTLVY